jgi:hypothetical protein
VIDCFRRTFPAESRTAITASSRSMLEWRSSWQSLVRRRSASSSASNAMTTSSDIAHLPAASGWGSFC